MQVLSTELVASIALIVACGAIAYGFAFLRWERRLGYQNPAAVALQIPWDKRSFITLVSVVGLASLAIIASSSIFVYYYYVTISADWSSGSGLKYLLAGFSIASENNIAAWYASMLFLLISVGCIALFAYLSIDERGDRRSPYTWFWLLLAILMAGLSADEAGSIHERAARLMSSGASDPQRVQLLAVFGVMAGLRSRSLKMPNLAAHWQTTVLFFIGALAISLVLLFEDSWEDRMPSSLVENGDVWRIIAYSMLEEGLELLGAWLFVVATYLALLAVVVKSASRGQSPEGCLFIRVAPGMLIGLSFAAIAVALAGVAIIEPLLELVPLDAEDGRLGNWFPASLAFTAAVLCWVTWKIAPRRRQHGYLVLAGVMLGLSMYYGASLQYWLTTVPIFGMPLPLIIFLGLLLGGVIVFGIAGSWRVLSGWQRVSLIAWFIGLALSFLDPGSEARIRDIVPFLFALPLIASLWLLESSQVEPRYCSLETHS